MIGQRFLFILRRPAADLRRAREFLEMLLTAAAFEQPVTLLVLDEGVEQLRRPTAATVAGDGVAPMLEALALYDLEAVCVERESLAERGLCERDLLTSVSLVDRSEIAALIAARDVVVND